MKLITWNIQWCRGCDRQVDPARIARVAGETADFDVLCLQEVAGNYPELSGPGRDQYRELAELLPGFTVIRGVATDVAGEGRGRREFGNAVVTRLPVRQVFRHLLPWPADGAVPSMQRAAVEVVLDTPSGPLRVTTTHLEYYSAVQRSAQVERLRALHEEACGHARTPPTDKAGPFRRAPRPASAILTADFNFRPEDPLYARLQAALGSGAPAYRDAWALRHPGEPHVPTLGVYDKEQWPGPPFACDFIFVTEDLAHRVEDVRVNASTDASDHQPVLLVLRD